MQRAPQFVAIAIATYTIAYSGIVLPSDTLPQFDRVMVLQTPREISNARLTDENGEPFYLSQLRGKVSLVLFGFTNCPDVCPAALGKFRQLEKSGMIDADKVSFVLISVDGERDTPEAMEHYLREFSENFIGLTAEPEQVRRIAREFRASFFKDGGIVNKSEYNVAHSTQAFLMDSAGRLRAELHSPTIEAMAGLTNALLD